jgi:hypothetical protein
MKENYILPICQKVRGTDAKEVKDTVNSERENFK